MINLMPIEEKKVLKNNFFINLFIVFLVMLSASFLIATIAILPAYLISFEKKESISQKLENEKNQKLPEINQEAQQAVEELNNKLSLIEKAESTKYIFSEKIIQEILLRKANGIKINKIFYENTQEGKKITIGGTAVGREELLAFRRAFENSPLFKDIKLPISNFVKDRNIQFNLDLMFL